jgi:hypothetical protein
VPHRVQLSLWALVPASKSYSHEIPRPCTSCGCQTLPTSLLRHLGFGLFTIRPHPCAEEERQDWWLGSQSITSGKKGLRACGPCLRSTKPLSIVERIMASRMTSSCTNPRDPSAHARFVGGFTPPMQRTVWWQTLILAIHHDGHLADVVQSTSNT